MYQCVAVTMTLWRVEALIDNIQSNDNVGGNNKDGRFYNET